MNRTTRKVFVLPFVLSAIFVDLDGCWRPITNALDWIGIDVSTDHGNVIIDPFDFDDDDDD